MEIRHANAAGRLVLPEKALGLKVGDWGIVLVQASDQHPIQLGAGGFGEAASPTLVSIITDFAPIDAAEDDRLAGAEQNESMCQERIIDLRRRSNAAPPCTGGRSAASPRP
jgi:hypothetical protein